MVVAATKKCDLVNAVSNILSVIHYKAAKNFAEEKSVYV